MPFARTGLGPVRPAKSIEKSGGHLRIRKLEGARTQWIPTIRCESARGPAAKLSIRGADPSIDHIHGDARASLFVAILVIKRQVPLKALQVGPLKETGGGGFKIVIDINQGVSTEKSREMVKVLKQSGLKVQSAIQEDHLRVSGKNKDDLQSAIKMLKEQDFGIPLQFTNYR